MPEEAGPEKDMSKELGIPDIELKQVQKAIAEAERKSAGREGRPVPEIAGGSPTPGEMFDRARRSFRGEREFGNGFVKVENPNSPEGWIKGILFALNRIEDRASSQKRRIVDEVFKDEIKGIEDAIDAIPVSLNEHTPEDITLTRVLGREIRLKEKLELIFAARVRLFNRAMEVLKAEGDLKQLGVGEKVPLAEGVAIPFTNILPIDWHVLIHTDDLLGEKEWSASTEGRELVPNTAEALGVWQEIGESWNRPVEGVSPIDPEASEEQGEEEGEEEKRVKEITFKKAVNSFEKMQMLRAAIAQKVGKRAEQQAFNIFSAAMTFEKWDKEISYLGSADARDLMYFDLKRRISFVRRLQPAGPEDTVGAYFSEKGQAQKERAKIKKERTPTSEEERRLTILEKNEGTGRLLGLPYSLPDRFVFRYVGKDLAKGQLVGDYWEWATLKAKIVEQNGEKRVVLLKEDEKAPKINFYNIASQLGWKKLPFLGLGETSYSGYFGYALNSAGKIKELVTKRGWDPEKDGLTKPGFWQETMATLDRMVIFSPYFNTAEEKEIERAKYMTRLVFARGVLWDGSQLTESQRKIVGIFAPASGRFTQGQVTEIIRAVGASSYLPGNYIGKLQQQTFDFRWSPDRPQRR